MPEDAETDSKQKKVRGEKEKIVNTSLKRILIGGIVALVVLLVFSFAQRAGRISFFTENLLSLLILVVITVQAYIYKRQWQVMERQGKAMQGQLETMNSQADTMKSSLELGQKNVETARDQMISTLRAYVSATGREGAGNNFRLTIENTGVTPARNVAVRYVLGQGFNAPHFSDAGADDFTYGGLLAPGRDFPLEVHGPELTPEVNQMMGSDPKFRLWFAGDITYLDAFGEMRETEFCMYRKYADTRLYPWPMRGYELTEEAETAN